MTEELRSKDNRHVLRIERELTHPIEKVWRALTESAQLSAWFPATVTVESQVGGKVIFDQGGDIMTGVVLELEPPRVLAFDWGGDLLRFELAESTSGTKLTFSHVFDVRSAAASFASGWHQCFEGLDQVLLGKEVVESTADVNELHEQYVAKLGLAAGTLGRGDDGWEVRFDRQLTKPAEEIWRVLTATSEAPNLGIPAPAAFTRDGESSGEVVEVDSPKLLEYRDGTELVRWEFQAGTGHGARLLLTHCGLTEADAELALTDWQNRIEKLAGGLATKQG